MPDQIGMQYHSLASSSQYMPSKCTRGSVKSARVITGTLALAISMLCLNVFAQDPIPSAVPPGTSSTKFPALAPPPPGEYIPRASDEKANYYLLSKTQTPEGLVTVSVRKSVQNSSYTKTLVNCAKHQFKVLGYSAVSAADTDNKTPQPNWSDIVPGTSKYEMVKMVCDK